MDVEGSEGKTRQPSADYVQQLEAERDELRRKLDHAERRTASADRDLNSARLREETERHASTQSANELKEAHDTINRQASSLNENRVSITKMERERDTAAQRADLLQSVANKRELEAHEREMLLAWVLESSVDAVLVFRSVVGENGEISDFECVLNNPAAVRLYGLDRLKGKRLLNLHPEIHEAGMWNNYLRVSKTGEPFEGEYCYAAATGTRWYRVLAIRVEGGLAITFSDISLRKQMEEDLARYVEELRLADRMKNEFLSVVSHELRTPINGMLGFLSIVKDELVGPLTSEQHDLLDKAEKSTERLLGLVSNMLDLGRVQAGKFTLDPMPTAFGPLVERALAELDAALEGHMVQNLVPDGLPSIVADGVRLTQVLKILIDNAAKFSSRPGTITIRACVVGPLLRCEVQDNGIGIAEDQRHKLFAVFSQVDMSSIRERGGAGLGLVLARTIVEAHGGTIGVESQEGQGSEFWFEVPVAP